MPEAAADAFPGILERLDQVLLRSLQRGHETEEHGGEYRDRETEQQNGEIQADLRFARDEAIRNQRRQSLDPGVSEQTADGGSSERKQQAFDQQLTDQPRPARS